MRSRSLGLFAVSVATSIVLQPPGAAQSAADAPLTPFLGTWELDPARTRLGRTTVTYEQDGDRIRMTSPSGTFTFKIDGADYPGMTPDNTSSFRQVDEHTVESTSKRNGTVQFISTRVFAPDGQTALVTTKRPRDASMITVKMERVSGPSGKHPIIGTWKNTPDLAASAPSRATYTPAEHGLHVRYEAQSPHEYTLHLDGQQRAPESTDQNFAGGMMLTTRRVNDRTIEEQWVQNGRPLHTSTITISPDGKELTEQQQPADAGREPTTLVFQRTK